MAHMREKAAFRSIGGLGLFFGLSQCLFRLGHLDDLGGRRGNTFSRASSFAEIGCWLNIARTPTGAPSSTEGDTPRSSPGQLTCPFGL